MATLFDNLGGAPAIDAAVDLFYRKVLADERVERFFKGVDMPKQIARQKEFLTMAFGGPNEYVGRTMRAAHKVAVAKGMSDAQFDVIVELLGETLSELGISSELVEQAAEVAESVRDDVLNRRPAAAV